MLPLAFLGLVPMRFALLPAVGIVRLRSLPDVRFLAWLRDSGIKG